MLIIRIETKKIKKHAPNEHSECTKAYRKAINRLFDSHEGRNRAKIATDSALAPAAKRPTNRHKLANFEAKTMRILTGRTIKLEKSRRSTKRISHWRTVIKPISTMR